MGLLKCILLFLLDVFNRSLLFLLHVLDSALAFFKLILQLAYGLFVLLLHLSLFLIYIIVLIPVLFGLFLEELVWVVFVLVLLLVWASVASYKFGIRAGPRWQVIATHLLPCFLRRWLILKYTLVGLRGPHRLLPRSRNLKSVLEMIFPLRCSDVKLADNLIIWHSWPCSIRASLRRWIVSTWCEGVFADLAVDVVFEVFLGE